MIMIQKGGDTLWQKKIARCWDRCTRKTILSAEPSAKFADVEHAVNLFTGILAFSLLGLWAELALPAPIGVGIKYGLTAVFAISYAASAGLIPAQMGIVKNRKAGFLLLFALAGPTGVFRLFQCACEELIYRGAILGAVSRWWGVAWGVAVSTVFFVAMHPGAGPVAWAIQAAFGLFACWWMVEKKEIWGLIGIHTAWNLIYDLRVAVGL